MTSAEKLAQAEQLFQDSKYSEAGNLAIEVLKEDPSSARAAYLMFAKSYLYLLTPFNLDDNQDTFFSAIGSAVDTAETIEEAFEIDYEVMTYIQNWRAIKIPLAIIALEQNPTFESWKEFIPHDVNITKLSLFAQVHMRNRAKLKEMYEAAGITVSEAAERYGKDAPQMLDDKMRYTLIFDSGIRIFERARAYLQENCNGNPDYVQAVMRNALERVMLGQLMVSYSTPAEDSGDVESRVLRMKSEAHIVNYMLTAMVYPNGQPMSFFHGDRASYISKLEELYAEVRKHEPNFVAPELPSVAPVDPPKGGCYVATAVYGSYDCPEVWTLRRFRDYSLAETWYGRAFIKAYYAVSPTLVKWFGETRWFKAMWKGPLDRMVRSLQADGVENTPYEDKVW